MYLYDRKSIFSLLSGFAIVSAFSLNAVSMPIPVGGPLRISPVPGPANPDPILQNLQVVMDDHYQPPYYPGVYDSPTYLENIYMSSDNYIANSLVCNPCNDQIMNIGIGQNLLTDLNGIFQFDTIGSNTFATSLNGGQTWSYGPPTEQIIPLGGNISQIINSSLGPGLRTKYAKNGRLDAGGWGFFDMRANPPNSVPTAGFLFTSSNNSGNTWDPTRIVYSSNNDPWFQGTAYTPGLYFREFYFTSDASNPDNIFSSTTSIPGQETSAFGNLYYFTSSDGGKNFTSPLQVYSMVDDPVWQANHFDPAYISNPAYFIYGGRSLVSSPPLQVDENTLLLPIRRVYPKIGSPIYTGIATSNFDQAVVRSLDKGKTWEKIASASDQFIAINSINDPGFANPTTGRILEGQLVFGFFSDFSGQSSKALVSPTTGRVYLCYAAANPASYALTPGFPSAYVLLNSSADKGLTWSPNVKVNQTPTSIPIRAQQAFSHGMVANLTGQICIAYYDFRNWTGVPGENLSTTPLPTDAWLAVYNETEDPQGGSTGVGLDFVGEYRLTPQSFNARIPSVTPPPPFLYSNGFITGTPEGIPMVVNQNNELYVAFSMSKPGFRSNVLLNQYKGMTIDTNSYQSILLQKFKFPQAPNN